MSSKLFDFLSSFGIMILGIVLLFAGSVTFEPAKTFPWIKLPVAGSRTLIDEELLLESLPLSRPMVPMRKAGSKEFYPLAAASGVVVDAKTKTLLFQKNIRAERPLASITKLMTAIVLLDLPINWSSSTVITEADADGSDHHLIPGEEYLFEDLWHIALVGSSNSAINSLVRSAGFSAEQFSALMNKKSKELGLASAYFVDPAGLSERNAANALDTATLFREALQREKILKTIRLGEYYARPLNKKKSRRVWSTNRLLTRWIPNKFATAIGKTGYTLQAGYNFAVNVEEDDDGRSLIVVVLGATTTDLRFTEARDLAEWTFSQYVWPKESGYDALYNSSTLTLDGTLH
ncbi:MAG: hypothetical protein UX39_C0004G0022 [Candidatus Magasanikbacteria bacterium GW2011_GWA2_46_17]|uniref:Peptidase S11 D-alanyl-D-alanine carboxypeptidase A N-terminal domain-containing protein n=1 Tax=Candidatus Magasanikbacteria bacterium GW2011_GWA2_46_17 TaxID=1619042 RepID=A0A0G1P2M7_9BACT|nr:MAG: hypothetical protein UX39_C0004G0022 [Candidatus Magasanikbacteria bacterium GW2011_GWA2_46_17]